MRARQARLAWVLLLLAALGSAALAVLHWRNPSPAPRLPLRIATAATPWSAALYQARMKGDFAAVGLEVSWIICDSGRQALDELLAGRCDIASVADAPLAVELARGSPLRLLGSLATCVDQTELIVRRDRGIAGPQDLAGRRVGLLLGSSADYMLDTLLELHGIDSAQIERVDAGPRKLAGILREGAVDGVAVWPPYCEAIRAELGDNALSFDSGGVYRWNWLLVAGPGPHTRALAEAERLMLRVLVDVSTELRQQPEASAARLATQLESTPAELLRAWRDMHLATRLDQALLLSLEAQARWAMAKGYALPGPVPNLLRVIDPVPLQTVAPNNVTLIHPGVLP